MGLSLRQRSFLTYLFFFVAFNIANAKTGDDNNYLFARIGVAKAAAAPVLQLDGTYNITYTVTLKNYGNETITGVQVIHEVTLEFPLAPTRLVGSVVATGSLIGDNNFNSTLLNITLLKPGSVNKVI